MPDEEISLCFGLVARMSIGLRDRVFCSGVVVERNDGFLDRRANSSAEGISSKFRT